MNTEQSINYRDAGVDIDAGNELVQRIKPLVKRTHNARVVNQLGGFAALYDAPFADYQQPLLVSATDGVGTKLMLAQQAQQFSGIGQDLVAMCVNDLITLGAKPLFFLDYYACGQLAVDAAADVVGSIAKGCEIAGCALVGGETAEMPGMYQRDDFDLAGFCVGIVDKTAMIDGQAIQPGDQLIGVSSSGAHANGYSLIRRIIEQRQIDIHQELDGQPLIDQLLAPTKIYVKTVLSLLEKFSLNGIAHITGGGISENLPRILPAHCQAVIDTKRWTMPTIFSWLQQQANLDQHEMWRTFNCGLGLIIAVNANDTTAILDELKHLGEQAFIIGHISERDAQQTAIEFVNTHD